MKLTRPWPPDRPPAELGSLAITESGSTGGAGALLTSPALDTGGGPRLTCSDGQRLACSDGPRLACFDGQRLACFDGLRAVAALSVVGVHTSFVSGFTGRSPLGIYTSRLEIGVSVFFVMSGFLLYRPWALAAAGLRLQPSVRRYFGRRLLRIVPAYWLAFSLVTYVLHADHVVGGWGAAILYYGFAQIYSPAHSLTGITQAWSLCTEMSFYAVLPGLALLLRGRAERAEHVGRGGRVGRGGGFGGTRRQLAGLAALVGVSFGFRLWALSGRGPWHEVMPVWLPAMLDLFALGMLLAVLTAWLGAHPDRGAWVNHGALPYISWALAAAAFVAVSHLGIPTAALYRVSIPVALLRQSLYGLFGLFLVAPAVLGPQHQSMIRRGLQLRPVVAVGVVSYGVYLWHQAWITLWLRWTDHGFFSLGWAELLGPVLVLAVASAAASYLLVERPLLRRGSGPPDGRVRSRLPLEVVAESPAVAPAGVGGP